MFKVKKELAICALSALLAAVICSSCVPEYGYGEYAHGTGQAVEYTLPRTDPPVTTLSPETSDLTETTEITEPGSETGTDIDTGTGPDPETEEVPVETGSPETETDTVTESQETEAPAPGTVSVKSIKVSAEKVYVGRPVQLTAEVLPADAKDKRVTWSVYSGSANCSVSSSGVLNSWKVASVTIKCASASNSKIYALYKVTPVVPVLWKGKGTSASPFLISSPEDFENLKYTAYCTSTLYFKQTCDIDLSSYGVWTPVGYGRGEFFHHYDGAGFRITGLKLGEISEYPYRNVCDSSFGLFAELGKCTVSNLTVEAECGLLTGNGTAGILCGRATGTTLKSVSVSGSLTSSGGAVSGGLCGELTGTVTGCTARVTVTGDGFGCGGLAGYYSGAMSKCASYGTVSGRSFCGGLIGIAEGISNISNCCSYADVNASAASVPPDSLSAPMALAVWAPSGTLIGCLTASGTVTSPKGFRVKNCFSAGRLNAVCDEMFRSSLIGYVADDLSRFCALNKLKVKMYADVSGNYSVDTADEFAHPREFPEDSAYSGKYESVPSRIVTNITVPKAVVQSTFKGWDFKSVWRMGEKGPELR